MAKKINKRKAGRPSKPTAPAEKIKTNNDKEGSPYLWAMSYAPKIDQSLHWMQLAPAVIFSAIVVMITRMASYTRPMEQFFWTNSGNNLTDFFSYYKMVFILICGALALIFLAYRLCTQSLAIKRSILYIPMGVYALCVLLSYAFSDYKEFALLGWNDRFEGTLVLLTYMIMLFYIINSINTAKAVKIVLYPIAIASAILGLLGVSQALDRDFFRTELGQKLIVPNTATESGQTTWDLISAAADQGKQFLSFTFQNREIYQTVYNINYVSFYLTLLIPIVGLLFIKVFTDMANARKSDDKAAVAHPVRKLILLAALFALLLYNLIGSASSGGFLGMFIVVLIAIILINKKIISWIKPLSVLVVITLIVGGITYERWAPEVMGAVGGAFAQPAAEQTSELDNSASEAASAHGKIDYINVNGNDISIGCLGEEAVVNTFPEDPTSVLVHDGDGNNLDLTRIDDSSVYQINDDRFELITLRPAIDGDNSAYIIVITGGDEWPFRITADGPRFINALGNATDILAAPAIGFENNPAFGSGRGYIWSRTIPMMEKTLILGHGADTYCIYFPQNDYVGKYNSGTFSSNINIIVDKPHNMYMGMWIGTGGISVIAFLAMIVIYAVQTIRIYWRRPYEAFLDYTGIGIFLGIMGFAVTGLVDDSTVSVMPMFYGLLGTGIAVNMIQSRNMQGRAQSSKSGAVSEEK